MAKRIENEADLIAFWRKVLSYDPLTGNLHWLTNRVRVKAGDIAGTRCGEYVQVHVNQQTIRAHRVAWAIFYGRLPQNEIDHINGVGSDNRIANLREVDRYGNTANVLRARNASGLIGAHLDKRRNKWFARLLRGGVTHHLGCFDTAMEAHLAYCAAREALEPGAADRIRFAAQHPLRKNLKNVSPAGA